MRWIRDELGTASFPRGLVCTTDHQYAGRGRSRERIWVDRPGEALLCSVALPVSDFGSASPGAISLKTGLAIARVIETYVPERLAVAVKWPNDVLVESRKIAGILLEKTREWVIIGFGINLFQGDFPPDLRRRAVSLALLSETLPGRSELLGETLVRLGEVYATDDWREEIERRLSRRGDRVQIEAAEFPGVVSGIIDGIAEDGALCVTKLRAPALTPVLPDPWLCYSGEILWNE